MLIKGFPKEPKNIVKTNEVVDLDKFLAAPRNDDRSTWKTSGFGYIKGADIHLERDWKRFPCCGGRGKKWVKKSSISNRQTLIECNHDATEERN